MPDTPRDDLLEALEAISRAQLHAIRRLRHTSKAPSKTRAGRRLSGIDMAEDILRRAGRPLHITDILAAVEKRFGAALDRESVVSAISKRVARQDRFLRTAPNTFTLIPEREDS